MTDLYGEALATFADLFEEAGNSREPEANAMIVSTATAAGVPSSRAVLMKSFDRRGFVFYTHFTSRKGREMLENPRAALLFLWRSLREAGIQVRIEGRVEQVEAQEADAYFASRPRASQIGAWASRQSLELDSRASFERHLEELDAEYSGRDVPRPPTWGGLRVVPFAFEFWYGARFRLHERWRYEQSPDGDGGWKKWMLYP
jgi:pyridoxamine 5'-phosphate oxidase